jgi:thioredoxin-like negative regulator of GroEL
VAEDMGDQVDILKLDVDQHPDLASALQIAGLPTMIFIGTDDSKPALRSEGLMTADTIKNILKKDLLTQ